MPHAGLKSLGPPTLAPQCTRKRRWSKVPFSAPVDDHVWTRYLDQRQRQRWNLARSDFAVRTTAVCSLIASTRTRLLRGASEHGAGPIMGLRGGASGAPRKVRRPGENDNGDYQGWGEHGGRGCKMAKKVGK